MGHSSTDPCYTEISIGPRCTRIDTLQSHDILVHKVQVPAKGKPILVEKLPTVHIGMARRALSKMPEKKLAVLMREKWVKTSQSLRLSKENLPGTYEH